MREIPPAETPGESAEAAAARAAAEERARRLEVEFLEGVRARLPDHPAVVESLGCLYTEMGRYQDGLAADRQMVQMDPGSPTAWYNLACSLSLTGQADAAEVAESYLETDELVGYVEAMQGSAAAKEMASGPASPKGRSRMSTRNTCPSGVISPSAEIRRLPRRVKKS